jgi:hypothetical protein
MSAMGLRLSDTEESNRLAREVEKSILANPKNAGKTDRQLKDQSNRNIRERVKRGATPDAKAVQDMLTAAGYDPNGNLKTVDIKAATTSNVTADQVRNLVESRRSAKALQKLAKGVKLLGAAIPLAGTFISTAANASSAATLATSQSSEDQREAALDLAGNVPVAGDLLDAARGGFALGEAADALLVDQEAAMRHGDVAKGLAASVGLPEGAADVVGGIAAAASAIVQFATWTPLRLL